MKNRRLIDRSGKMCGFCFIEYMSAVSVCPVHQSNAIASSKNSDAESTSTTTWEPCSWARKLSISTHRTASKLEYISKFLQRRDVVLFGCKNMSIDEAEYFNKKRTSNYSWGEAFAHQIASIPSSFIQSLCFL